MPSSSVFFYGRRSRSCRPFDDLTVTSTPSSSSSSSSSDPSFTASTTNHHRYHHRNSADPHPHRRHRHTIPDDSPSLQLRSPSHPPTLSPLQESEPPQRECVGELPSVDISQETVQSLSRRFSRNNRLPGPVLLAKERLLQRLRGVSVSGGRQRRERSLSLHCEDLLVIDADWETNVFGEQADAAGLHQLMAPEEQNKKPMGLTNETLSQLHHEIFQEHEIDGNPLKSEASTDCSICLENFAEGNKIMGLPCGHRFHVSCLYPWLRTCGECPYCRSCILPSA